MKRTPKGRLELTWMGKDAALIPVADGQYDYAWVDPDDPRAREVKSINVQEQVGTVDGPTGADENLLIVGDSGDALRSLATIPEYHAKYAGRVKLVYIDPPFNTGQTFDHYADQMEHSIWLTMMRDRIRDLKPLLAPDASVWVHLDDAEVHRMRVLLDEEFGPENFVGTIIWHGSDIPKSTARQFSTDQDYILVYAHDASSWKPHKLPRSAAINARYTNPDNDLRGPWMPGPITATKPYSKGSYVIRGKSGQAYLPTPGTYWRIPEMTFLQMDAEGRISWGASGDSRPLIKRYLSEVGDLVPRTIWHYNEVGSTRHAKNEMKALFPESDPFSTPKPERLMERIIAIATDPGDLVLDFFAGSGTTAAVAHKLGRRWITVELQTSNVERFTLPRLSKVVEGVDLGGISTAAARVPTDDVDLPDGMDASAAQQFNTLLSKVVKSVDGLDSRMVAALRAATKTRSETVLKWSGGGGFTVARMGPSMYEVDDTDGEVYLSQAATNGAWSKAVAGQLKFTLTPDHPVFVGVRKRQRLAVIDGVADENVVRTVVEALGAGERAMIVAKGVVPEADVLLRSLSPGSRLKKAPADIFPKGTVN